MDFVDFRSWFDRFFTQLIQEKIASFTEHSSSDSVAQSVAHLLLLSSNGKRLRPYLTFVALETDSPDDHRDLFAALELLHIFALIHDDIMDNGTTRHGVQCAHRLFSETYGNTRVGEGFAILLGDIVYQWSYECMIAYVQKYPLEADRMLACFGELISEVSYGQMLDIISPTQPPYSLDLITQKMYLKTARYSFVQPLRLGFIAGGNGATRNVFAEEYGTALGLMFQIQDDLIDVTEGHNKSSFLDIETNQQTLLSWFMATKADKVYRTQFSSYLGKQLTSSDRQVVSAMLRDSGAHDYAQREIENYYQKALSVSDTNVWKTIASLVRNRTT